MTNEEAIKILKNVYLCRINIKDGCYPWECKNCEHSEDRDDVTQAINYAISALSKQCASSVQVENLKEALTESDRIYEASAWWENYIKARKKTKEELISKHEALDKLKMLCEGCYLMEHCGQCNPNCLLRKAMDVVEKIKTDSERVSLSEQEKSNSFSKEPSESSDSEMNCSDVPDTNVGKTDEDTISRQAAIDEIEYELEMINSALDSITLDFNARERLRQRRGEAREILNSIQQLPSAQPEPKTGQWTKIHWKAFRCSECNRLSEFCTDFCPNCGSPMLKEGENIDS